MMQKLFLFINKKSRIFGGHGLRRFRIINAIHNYVAKKAFGDKAVVNGYTLFTDPAEGFSMQSSVWEEDTTELIKSKFRPGEIFVDIGADIGYYTALAARLGAGHIYSFEPNPRTRAILEKNIAVNNIKNVSVFDKAVSDKEGNERFYTHGAHSTMGYNYNKNTSKHTTVGVKTIALDTILDKVDFIKMDIEGSEPKAVRGMRKLLEKNKHIHLITEFFPQLIKLAGDSPLQFLEELREIGFSIYDIKDLENQVSFEKLIDTYKGDSEGKFVHSEDTVTNLYCVK